MIRRRLLMMLAGLAIALFLAWQIKQPRGLPDDLGDVAEGYDVEILRDEWGVPHIIGRTDADAAFGLAYAHAEDDFATIQGTLLAARGMLATVFGSDAAPNDYMAQLLRIDEIADQAWARLDSATKALSTGYANGLNVYASRHPGEAMPGIYPVSGRDVVAGFVHKTPLFFDLDDTLSALFSVAAADTTGSSRSAGLPSIGFRSKLNLKKTAPGRLAWGGMLKSAPDEDLPDHDLLDENLQDLVSQGEDLPDYDVAEYKNGSNAIAVAPSRTEDGSTYLAVNSHQPWTGPVAWYEAHVMSDEGWNAAGGLFPGAPVILVGHNQDLGWGHTVNRPDVIDLYDLETHPDDPSLYRFDGEWRAFETAQAEIPVRLLGLLQWTFERELVWSVHGPVVRTDTGAVAIRFSGWGDGGQIRQWYRMNRATNFTEWQAAMSEQAVPVFNAVYADREGHIHYVYNARFPARIDGPDWRGALAGNTSETLWEGYEAYEDLPSVDRPEAGFVQSCNNTPFFTTGGPDDPVPADFPIRLGVETRMTNRALRAVELLATDETLTWDRFKEIKYDMRYSASSKAARLVRQLRFASMPQDSLTQAARQVILDWDLSADPANREAALAIRTFRPYLTSSSRVPDSEALVRSLTYEAGELLKHFGTLRPEWSDVNRLRRGIVDLGLGGAPDVLHAVHARPAEDGRLVGYAGDSYVMLVRWLPDGTVESESVHQFGSATLDPESPHYADQAPLFVNRQLKKVYFSRADAEAAAVRRYRPADG